MHTWLTRLNVVFRGSGASLSVLANTLQLLRERIVLLASADARGGRKLRDEPIKRLRRWLYEN